MEEKEGNMITDWLDKHGNPEIEKQVEKILEAKEIEQAAANLADPNICKTDNWIAGAKWQAERSYSEEEVVDLIADWTKMAKGLNINFPSDKFEIWFEQFKKK